MQRFNELFLFLANPPGNLVYILAVAFILIGSLQIAIIQLRINRSPLAKRMVFGLGLLIAIQLILFIFSGLVEQDIFKGRPFLPIVDRAVILISIAWLIWLWAFPVKSTAGDAATVLVSLVIFGACVLSGIFYLSGIPESGSFNSSFQALLWNLGGVLILALGISVLLISKPSNWGTGLTVATILLVGLIVDIFSPAKQGDFSGIIRFSLLTVFPLIFTITTRFLPELVPLSPEPESRSIETIQKSDLQVSGDGFNENPSEGHRYTTDLKTLQSLLSLAAESDTSRVNLHIVRSVAQAMLSDLCFLILIGEDKNSLFIAAGFELISEKTFDRGNIGPGVIPALSDAIIQGQPLLLAPDSPLDDLKEISELLGLPEISNLLAVPISDENGIVGSLLLISSHSPRVWNVDDQSYLLNVASTFVPIIVRSQQDNFVVTDTDRANVAAKDAVDQSLLLQQENVELITQLDELKIHLEQANSEVERHKVLLNQANSASQDRAFRDDSEKNIALSEMSSSDSQLEKELRMTLVEMARLQNQLAESNSKIIQLEDSQGETINTDQFEVITGISQELRQPMSSIIGYSDLLLGESVGILGALQRKFIERIHSSTERIGSLVDDLIQVTSFVSGSRTVKPETIDLNLVIDNAMAFTSSQMREKNITLRIDIPESLSPFQADRDVLQQILIHLLQNAGAASPAEGLVTLRVRTQKEAGTDHVIVQVSDTGSGIPKEDLSRVFSRTNRADTELIQGVGETGVGLSIAKTLTDAQNGRIWVDSEVGIGTTFSVSLPLRSSISAEIHKGD